MAAGDTAQVLALSSSPPPVLDHSPSNLSSPLSDVEDKEGEGDDMNVDMQKINTQHTRALVPGSNGHRDGGASGSDSDELSEADVNDSEAETERLYNTPPKSNGTHDNVVYGATVARNTQFTDRRDRPFERSPSKLQQQVQPEQVAHEASDDDSLSDVDHDENDDISLPPSDSDAPPTRVPRSRSLLKKTVEEAVDSGPAVAQERQTSSDSRKRKRSSPATNSEADQPLRKRTGSVVALENEFSADETAVIDDEGVSTNPQSGLQSGEEDNQEDRPPARVVKEKPERPAPSIEEEVIEQTRTKKSKRSTSKNLPSPDQSAEDAVDGVHDDVEGVSVGNASRPAEDEALEAELDEEAEAAHKEEELERKKSAWEELTAIEKQFSNFRERLYQERLEQLNKEEAMLTGPNPTHPEYLAMLQCVNERRDERIRLAGVELQLKMDVLKKRAVAERAQIMCQFYQSVRESREKVLELLGKDWYEIQHERRRQANNIPDFGIRYPAAKTHSVRNAVAYNREVSILSGFAKHVGFPAAPNLGGASEDQVDRDFEAIQRVREVPVEPTPQYPTPPFHRELSGSLSFGRIGLAGELFIEQTPWANPNHPSHNMKRHTHPETSTGRRRHSRQIGEQSTSKSSLVNGTAQTPAQKSVLEALKPSKAVHEVVKLDSVATAS